MAGGWGVLFLSLRLPRKDPDRLSKWRRINRQITTQTNTDSQSKKKETQYSGTHTPTSISAPPVAACLPIRRLPDQPSSPFLHSILSASYGVVSTVWCTGSTVVSESLQGVPQSPHPLLTCIWSRRGAMVSNVDGATDDVLGVCWSYAEQSKAKQ